MIKKKGYDGKKMQSLLVTLKDFFSLIIQKKKLYIMDNYLKEDLKSCYDCKK